MSANKDKNDKNMTDDADDLDAYIAERDKREPGFAALVEAALQRRREARARDEDPNDAFLDEEETEEQPTTPNVGA